MLNFIYTDLISSLVDPESTLIYVGAYDPRCLMSRISAR